MQRLSSTCHQQRQDDAASLASCRPDDLADPRSESGDPQRQRRHLAVAGDGRNALGESSSGAAYPRGLAVLVLPAPAPASVRRRWTPRCGAACLPAGIQRTAATAQFSGQNLHRRQLPGGAGFKVGARAESGPSLSGVAGAPPASLLEVLARQRGSAVTTDAIRWSRVPS